MSKYPYGNEFLSFYARYTKASNLFTGSGKTKQNKTELVKMSEVILDSIDFHLERLIKFIKNDEVQVEVEFTAWTVAPPPMDLHFTHLHFKLPDECTLSELLAPDSKFRVMRDKITALCKPRTLDIYANIFNCDPRYHHVFGSPTYHSACIMRWLAVILGNRGNYLQFDDVLPFWRHRWLKIEGVFLDTTSAREITIYYDVQGVRVRLTDPRYTLSLIEDQLEQAEIYAR